jgi:four helix bundle protein
MKSQNVNKSKNQNGKRASAYAFEGRLRGDLPDRSFSFGCAVIDLVDELPSNVKGWTIGKQLIRCGTSVGANIAEADQAISDAEFIQRCSIARKEAAETRYWLRVCHAKHLARPDHVAELLSEVDELLRVIGTIIRKSQAKK